MTIPNLCYKCLLNSRDWSPDDSCDHEIERDYDWPANNISGYTQEPTSDEGQTEDNQS